MNKEMLSDARKSFNDIMDAALEIQKTAVDYNVEDIARNLYVTDDVRLRWRTDNWGFRQFEQAMSEWALGQLGNKLGVPSGYVYKCLENGMPELAAENLNRWLLHPDRPKQNVKVRTVGDRPYVRGIVSNRYTVFDAPEILDPLFQTIPEGDWTIKGSYINPERLHLRIVSNEKMDIDGDLLFPAIFWDSSDVGRAALRLSFGIYRLACSNGMIVPRVHMGYYSRHIGKHPYEIAVAMEEAMGMIPDMIADAEDMIRYADSQNISLLTQADVEAVTTMLTRRTPLSESEAKRVIEITKEKYNQSLWGLVNGITEHAHNRSLEGRLELERAAGQLLVA